MSKDLIYEPSPLTAEILDKRDVLVLVVGASREDGEHVTDAQKATAMNAAKSVLQMVGADVAVSSTAFLCNAELTENETLTVETAVKIWKNAPDADGEETTSEEPTTVDLDSTELPDESEIE